METILELGQMEIGQSDLVALILFLRAFIVGVGVSVFRSNAIVAGLDLENMLGLTLELVQRIIDLCAIIRTKAQSKGLGLIGKSLGPQKWTF